MKRDDVMFELTVLLWLMVFVVGFLLYLTRNERVKEKITNIGTVQETTESSADQTYSYGDGYRLATITVEDSDGTQHDYVVLINKENCNKIDSKHMGITVYVENDINTDNIKKIEY